MSSLKYLGVLAVSLLVGTAAMAAPVSTNISACVNSSTGAVRIVASTFLCVPGETGMSWALVGPTGITGPQGPAGVAGPAGTPGVQGPAGAQGAVGATGATGPQGTPGATGLQGPIGLTGTPGAQGNAGTNGTNGATGPQGTPGALGNAGTNGTNGAAATITVGTTTTGAAGSNASVSNGGNSSAAIFNFTIPKGATGALGPTGNAGSQGAPGTTGLQGLLGNTGPAGPAGPEGVLWTAQYENGDITGAYYFAPIAYLPDGPSDTYNEAYIVPDSPGEIINGTPSPIACTMSFLKVAGNNFFDSLAESAVFTVLKNGTATGMHCTVNTPSGGTSSCSDTTDTFSVAPGDFITIKTTQSSTTPYVMYTISTACY